MTAIDTSALTSEEIRQLGFEALVARLGAAGALRFLMGVRRGRGDYLDIQDSVFGEMSVAEIHADAKRFWKDHPELWQDKEVV